MPPDSAPTDSNATNSSNAAPTDDAVARWLRRRTDGALKLSSIAIEPGDVFFAVKGAVTDGRTFILDALTKGAAALVVEADDDEPEGEVAPMRMALRNLKARMGPIAAAYHDHPGNDMAGVAVTGTNGKTTVSWWTTHMMNALGVPAASIGTVGCWFRGERTKTALTTPDALTLHGMLAHVKDEGAKAYALEASSAGLLEGRLLGLPVTVAVFTNLTQDHLDLHGTMEAYGEAKAILFETEGLGHAVLNADDAFSKELALKAAATGAKIWWYSTRGVKAESGAEEERAERLTATDLVEDARGTRFTLRWGDECAEVFLPHPGRYNVENALAAAGAMLALGHDFRRVAAEISRLPAPPGRLERLEEEGKPMVVVDYCHTPDAFEQVLSTLRLEADARGGDLVMVFGCCGARDHGKRPKMGAVAERLADRVVVTADNPRHEDPAQIAREILSGMAKPQNVRVELDRAKAITLAVLEAGPRDVIILAGKGPETYQILKDGAHVHSDRETALAAQKVWGTV